MFDLIGWNVDSHASTDRRFQTVEAAEQAIIEYIDRGIPIMIDWVDWAGHWQVLIGIDACGTDTPYDDALIFANPYDVTDHKQDGYYTYPLGRFSACGGKAPALKKRSPVRCLSLRHGRRIFSVGELCNRGEKSSMETGV